MRKNKRNLYVVIKVLIRIKMLNICVIYVMFVRVTYLLYVVTYACKDVPHKKKGIQQLSILFFLLFVVYKGAFHEYFLQL